jgi:HK97 family phage major capsid protein
MTVAISAATQLSGFDGFLTEEESAPIFNDAIRQSVAMQLARRVPLGINGNKIPVVTSKPSAGWVGEGAKKPTTEMGLGLKHITPHKLAAIAVMSAEVVRANPGNYATSLRTYLAEAFAVAFDYAALYDLGGDGTGTSPFTDPINSTTKAVALGTTTQANGGIHGDLVAGMKLLVDDGKKLTGFALDDVVEPTLWGAVDTSGRPLYVDLPTDDVAPGIARPGRLLNRPSFMGDGVAEPVPGTAETAYTVAFGGDWSKAAWGAVGGISFRVSTEASVTIGSTLTSLWEQNLVAVLAEAEYGWLNADKDAFVKYQLETPAEG